MLQWCYQMKCLMVGERPGITDGGWSPWSSWSRCSRTCGSGVAHAVRKCNQPSPSKGGSYCIGVRKRHKICATDVSFESAGKRFPVNAARNLRGFEWTFDLSNDCIFHEIVTEIEKNCFLDIKNFTRHTKNIIIIKLWRKKFEA